MSYASVSPRDLRDPAELGKAIRSVMAHTGASACQVADEIDAGRHGAIPDLPHHESTATMTARAYREELEARAAQGDKYAASMLRGEAYDEGEVADRVQKAEPEPEPEPQVVDDKPLIGGYIDGQPVYVTQAEYEELQRLHNGNGIGV